MNTFTAALAAAISTLLVAAMLTVACVPTPNIPSDGNTTDGTPATTHNQPAPTVTVTTPSQQPNGTVTTGTYLVGTDIPAGTWTTTGPEPGDLPNCYWERSSDASGQLEAIIANANTTGPAIVTLKPGDYFTTMGCNPWTPKQ